MMKFNCLVSLELLSDINSLTSTYAPFVNGGKKIEPNLFQEYKTEEEKQFIKRKIGR